LKDCQERRLEVVDIRTYCRIATEIGNTMGIQGEIDELYAGVESEIVTARQV
jgi:hypothetical protein